MAGEWSMVELGRVAINLDTRRVPVKESDRVPGPYPYYGASGVVDHVNGYLFDGDYLLVAEDGENLRTRQTPVAFMATGKFWVNNHAHILEGGERARTRYLAYALSVADIAGYLTGAVMPKLTQANLARIPIPLPGLEEQDKIVGILGSLDDKIELNRRMAATLEEAARALFKSWFIDFDPIHAKAHNQPTGLPHAISSLFPSRFGNDGLPEGWTKAPLLDHARLISGGTPKTDEPTYWDGPVLWASAKDVSQCADRFLISTERTITRRGLEQSATRLVPARSTVVVARGATTGRHCLFGREMAMNQTCYALHSDAKRPFWLACTFSAMVSDLVRGAHGSVFDTITTTTLQTANLIYGGDEVVSAFERSVQPIYERILNLVEESATLRALRDTLLPKLISGELRVKDAGATVVAA